MEWKMGLVAGEVLWFLGAAVVVWLQEGERKTPLFVLCCVLLWTSFI